MVDTRFAFALCALLVIAYASPLPKVRARRQLADDNSLQPIEDADGDEQTREKRKFEGVTQAKFGIKNAVLGFVFGDGITSRRQVRSTNPERVSLLPTSETRGTSDNTWGTSSNGRSTSDNNWGTLSNERGTMNKERGTSNNERGTLNNKRGTLNNSWGTSNNQWGTSNIKGTRNIGDTSDSLSPSKSLVSSNTRGLSTNSDRGVRQADDIPVFDRNKVSLDFPGALFGPSLSLLIKTTKIVGDVIQNSAVRYQSFLRLFRPLFRGPFEIKGLDPPTTTTTTTTTTTKAPVAADNEVRRR